MPKGPLAADGVAACARAEAGARRLLGVGLMLCLIVESGLVFGIGAAPTFLQVANLLFVPVLAGLGVVVFRRWQACLGAWRKATASIAEHERARISAETANLAKSRYLSNVSHEIRSPLNAIYGYAQLVERNDGVGALEAAVVIRRCAEHITSLVEALLDISQVENGVIRVKPEPVRLDQFMDQILRMVRPAATAKGLEFHYETQGRLPAVVRMDPSRLRQVLLNLLFNAVKYTDRGSVTMFLRYSAQIATFEVRDTGPGIREEDRKAIFEPFERGGDDALRERPGVGLGLSIARAIVDFLGGKLELAQMESEGACFRLTMMLGEVTAPSGQSSEARARRDVSGYLGRRRSILLCDDDAEQRKFLSDLLVSLGFSVEAVPNGETALALVAGAGAGAGADTHVMRRFDLAILDISLPGIDGWEVAAQLRDRLGDEIRILMLSANAQEFHRPETRVPVHDHFLVKPVEFHGLIEIIGGLLDLAWGVETGGRESAPVAPPKLRPALMSATPGDANTARIRELLRIGYIRGIEQEIRQLAEQPDSAELADRLYAYLDRYDLPGMSRLLEEC